MKRTGDPSIPLRRDNLVVKELILILTIALTALSVGTFLQGGEGEFSNVDPVTFGAADWPWWRGPNLNGIAASDQSPPLHWSETENVVWKAPVPGRGHGSPTVVGNRVFLATAETEAETQSVLCYDRRSGKLLWKTEVHRGGLEIKGHKKASLASATVACDGSRLFINFLNRRAIYTTALSLEGKQLWQTKAADFVVHQGFGSSPAVYRSLVIVSADNKGGGAIVALDRSNGAVVWRHDRPKKPNYTSPIILRADGREQLVMTGSDLVSSFDPLTGEKLWEIEGSTTECVTSTVTDGQLVFTSGGYPRKHISAVRADGSGEIAWESSVGLYVPSMLVQAGHIFAVTDNGVASCWKSSTGQEIWRGRLSGTFSASPVLVGEYIFAVNESGKTFVFKADPGAFELVAENDLGGEEVLATPAICGSRIYLRLSAIDQGRRSEVLYCIGK